MSNQNEKPDCLINLMDYFLSMPMNLKDQPIQEENQLNILSRKEETQLNCKTRIKKRRQNNVYECDICNTKISRNKRKLRSHMWHIHKYTLNRPVVIEEVVEYYVLSKKINVQLEVPIFDQQQYVDIRKIEQNQSNVCAICGRMFDNAFKTRRHEYDIHLKVKHRCMICLELFTNDRITREHLTNTHNIQPRSKGKQFSSNNTFFCSYCGKEWRTSRDLIVHEARVHNTRGDHFCEVCGSFFATKGELRKHKRRIHSELYDKCPKCNTICLEKEEINTHTCNAAYNCKACAKPFSTSSLLYKHERECSVSYKCEYKECTLSFKTHRGLDKHIRRHKMKNGEIESKYTCNICSKICFDNYHLHLHLKNHSSSINII